MIKTSEKQEIAMEDLEEIFRVSFYLLQQRHPTADFGGVKASFLKTMADTLNQEQVGHPDLPLISFAQDVLQTSVQSFGLIRIEFLEFSRPVYNRLQKAGIQTLGELLRSPDELLHIPGFEREHIAEIRDKLRERGLSLPMVRPVPQVQR